nr:mechanosensitive ion channel protein 3, chloroplastic isoform X1 [Tanacetum cinerariifolium]
MDSQSGDKSSIDDDYEQEQEVAYTELEPWLKTDSMSGYYLNVVYQEPRLSYEAFHGWSLVVQLILAVGVIAFAAWGLGPLLLGETLLDRMNLIPVDFRVSIRILAVIQGLHSPRL